MDIVATLQKCVESQQPVYFTLMCRLGNPAEMQGVSKYGTVSELTINEEKPKQSYFYIDYKEVGLGGAVRFKASPNEVKLLVDDEGNILYEEVCACGQLGYCEAGPMCGSGG